MVLVIPQNDEREHIEDVYCWCEPLVAYRYKDGTEYPDGPLIIHNAADCREIVEEAVELLGGEPHRSSEKGWWVIPV